MIDFIKRILSRYGFFRKCVHLGFIPDQYDWQEFDFYTADRRKTERLAAIASEIAALNVKRLKAKAQKKNQTLFVLRMNELMRERLTIEGGEFRESRQAQLNLEAGK